MATPTSGNESSDSSTQLPFPMEHWQAIVQAMQLAPQEARTAELVLQGLCDKQIAAALGVREPTIRTYLSRIAAKTGAHRRMELATHVLGLSYRLLAPSSRRQD